MDGVHHYWSFLIFTIASYLMIGNNSNKWSSFACRVMLRLGHPRLLLLRMHFQLFLVRMLSLKHIHVLLRSLRWAPIEDLIHPLIMEPVEFILLLQCLLEAHLSLEQISEQGLDLLVEFFILLGGEQSHEVVVDFLAELSGRVVVFILAVQDVLQQRGRVLPTVEWLLQTKSLVELVEEFVVVLGTEYLADFILGVCVGEGE